MSKKLNELKTQFEVARKRMQDEGKAALSEALQELFVEHPKLISIRWLQYTPYFNDGETCEFSVNNPYIKFAGLSDEAGDDGDGFDSYSDWQDKQTPYPEGFKAADKAVSDIFKLIPDELMLAVFNDHSQVTATREGFEVEEYEHE